MGLPFPLNNPNGYWWFERVATPRRVRLVMVGHGVQQLQRLQRSRAHPEAHWVYAGSPR